MLFLFVMAFVIVPAIFIRVGSRHKQMSHTNFQECPSCGADNYRGRERCYCCGYDLAESGSAAPVEGVLERVRKADENRAKRQQPARAPQAVKD
jgi:predicted amidophosphoribosyltransferase